MRVKALRTIAGPWGTFMTGEIADLPEKIARSIISVHGAEEVEDEPKPVEAKAEEIKSEPVYETVVTEPPEAAEFPPRRRRKT